MQEFNGDMGRVATGAAVSHAEQPAAATVDVRQRPRRRDQERRLFGEEKRWISRDWRLVLHRAEQRGVGLRRLRLAAVDERAELHEVAFAGHDAPCLAVADLRITRISACASPSSVRIFQRVEAHN